MKHTPTPWRVENHDGGFTIYPVDGPRDGIGTSNGHYRDLENKRLDGEFIVRACNAHDELLQAVYDYANMLTAHCEHEVLEKVEALIAKAEAAQ